MATADLRTLRLAAEDEMRRRDDAALVGRVGQLRGDIEWWPHIWAPACAVSAARLGTTHHDREAVDAGADLLREATEAGFCQPDLFAPQLERRFGDLADWPELERRMHRTPAPRLELIEWPDAGPQFPVELDRLDDDAAARLAARGPGVRATAWETVLAHLDWVSGRWDHANAHVDSLDAHEILDRAEAGEAFACREFAALLAQGLNAVGVPARRVSLREEGAHVGCARGHMVAEAWVDGLGRWVLLDPQNRSVWVDEDGHPLGVPALQERHAQDRPARMIDPVRRARRSDAELWWAYFAGASASTVTWGDTFTPVFQDSTLLRPSRLLHDPTAAYPDLDAVSTGVCGTLDAPAVSFTTPHPWGIGFVVVDRASGRVETVHDAWRVPSTPGRHEYDVAVLTPVGRGRSHRLVLVGR